MPGRAVTRVVVLRALLAGLGVAVVALAFTASYIGALHDPTPREVPVAVARQVPEQVAVGLDRSPALRVVRRADASAARRAVDRRDAYGAVTATRRGFALTTAPAASLGIATLLRADVGAQLRRAGRPVTITEVHALPAGDSRGLVSFYVVAGWTIAGYLGATLFGITFGTQIGRERVLLRLGAIVGLGLVVGLGGALIARAMGDLTGPTLGLTLLGTLVVAAVGATTVALQAVLGIAGTGVAILLFVILGNPASGGPAATELLPSPWREIGQAIPVGAGVTAFRDASYFPDAPLAVALVTLLAWLAAGVAVSLAYAGRAQAPTETEAEVAAAAAAAG